MNRAGGGRNCSASTEGTGAAAGRGTGTGKLAGPKSVSKTGP